MKKNFSSLSRVTALVLSSVMLLSACGDKPLGSSESTTNTDKESSVASETKTEVVEEKMYWEMLNDVSDTSELPDWEGDTLEVNVWFAAGTYTTIGEIPETDVCFEELERVTGVRFNFEESFDNGGNNIDAKLPMVIASGEYPTIVTGYDIGKQMAELYEEGYLADLTEYYNDGTLDQLLKYLPLDESMSYVYSNCVTEDGEFYLIPNGGQTDTVDVWSASGYEPEGFDRAYYSTYGETPKNYSGWNTNGAVLVREDILQAMLPDTLTLEEIEQIYVEKGGFTAEEIFDVKLNSSEEFFQFLRDLQDTIEAEGFVGLDGKPVEVMAGPHTETDNWSWMVILPNLIDGLPAGTDYFVSADYTPEDESSLLEYAFSSDYYVNYMKELNQLVRENVISQDSMLDNSATFKEKCYNGRYAVLYAGQYWPYDDNHEEFNYRPIWINSEYNSNEFGGFSTMSYKQYFGIFKDTLSDEELDQLMHAINYLNSEVGIKNFYWGPASAGLFTEDAEGNRVYTDEELIECMIGNVDNGAATKYGIVNTSPTSPTFNIRPKGVAEVIFKPSYLTAATREKTAQDARAYFNPGTLEGLSRGENSVYVSVGCEAYGSLGTQIEGLNTFWNARNGFENQIKKVIVSESDAEFEKQFEELISFTENNGLTEKTLAEFNELFVNTNRDKLEAAGIIK